MIYVRYDSLFRPSIITKRQFMWQDDLVQVAQFIRLSLGRVYNGLDTADILTGRHDVVSLSLSLWLPGASGRSLN
jgi:hypothetical protein